MIALRREPLGERVFYLLYALVALVLVVPALVVIAIGAALRPRWRAGLAERAGVLPEGLAAARARSPRIWVHAASIGEVRAAHPLLAALRARFPEGGIFLTTTTPEGNRIARGLGLASAVGMLPADLPGVPGRVLDAFAPDLLVLLETELWPGLLRAARRRLLPVVVVNGRISPRSFKRYRAARRLLAPALGDIAGFSMQAATDRDRILALGADPARVVLHGNLKYDALSLPQPAPPAVLAPLAAETVWIAGSTHDGEEAAVADAFVALRASLPALRLVVAPRHLKRVEDARRALESRGLTVVRRSTLAAAPAPGDVVLLDTAGELAALYGIATAVFVGGSLIPRGGHNPLEPLAHGRPVAFGPYTENFHDVTKVVLASGGAIRVGDSALLAEAMRPWLTDPAAARAQGDAARSRILTHHGALPTLLPWLTTWLGEAGASEGEMGAGSSESLLGGVAWGVGAVAVARKGLYDAGALPATAVGIPVIALGGVVAGGTGKTPGAIHVARMLASAGKRVAVVSRGYGGEVGASPRVVSAGGWNPASHDPMPPASVVGDEPRLIAMRAPGAAVVVHPDRVAAARVARAIGAEVIVLDDGLQHRRLARDLEIAFVDARAPFGNGRFLPAGPLRDTPDRLADADLVLLTRADAAGPGAAARARARLSLVTAAPTALFGHRIVSFAAAADEGGKPISAEALAARRPYAFCGIASPRSFLDGVAAAGIAITGAHEYADHAPFDANDVATLEAEARAAGSRALLTTEKDASRWPGGGKLPVYVAVLELVALSPADEELLRAAVFSVF